MTEADALTHLTRALGSGYEGATDEPTLKSELAVDGRGGFRPWATAARLIKFNTEYEVGGDLQARIDRKLAELEQTQRDADDPSSPPRAGRIKVTWGDL